MRLESGSGDLRWRRLYDRLAPVYDLSIGLWALLLGYSDTKERLRMVRRLKLKTGHKVLEVSVGTGSNLALMAPIVGKNGRLVGLDLSPGMLRQCRRKIRAGRMRASLIEGEASRLPLTDGVFDAVLHFGGINEFSDRKGAVREMMRVAKRGARIVIGDESLAPAKRGTLSGKLLIWFNSLYAHEPPLEIIPSEAKDVRLRYFRGDACYLIDFTKP